MKSDIAIEYWWDLTLFRHAQSFNDLKQKKSFYFFFTFQKENLAQLSTSTFTSDPSMTSTITKWWLATFFDKKQLFYYLFYLYWLSRKKWILSKTKLTSFFCLLCTILTQFFFNFRSFRCKSHFESSGMTKDFNLTISQVKIVKKYLFVIIAHKFYQIEAKSGNWCFNFRYALFIFKFIYLNYTKQIQEYFMKIFLHFNESAR